MIIVNIRNTRLGDQLLKYLAGRVLSKHIGTNLSVSINNSTDYHLSGLGFNPSILNNDSYHGYYKIEGDQRIYRKKKLLKIQDNVMLCGLWYHYKYYDTIIDDIRKEVKRVKLRPNTIGIHIRRGDFVKLKNRIPCEVDYVKEAISKFKCKKYLITTDDIKWCNKNIKPLFKKVEIYSSKNPVQDFIRLVSCDKLIISSSVFSWCAAIIADVPTICPEKWMNSGKIDKIGNQHCPPEWIRI
jgi:hypothetical protein